jgi:hypothetical protein
VRPPRLLLLGRRPRRLGRLATLSRGAGLLRQVAGGSAGLVPGVTHGARDRHRPVSGLRLPTTRAHPIGARLIAISISGLRLGAAIVQTTGLTRKGTTDEARPSPPRWCPPPRHRQLPPGPGPSPDPTSRDVDPTLRSVDFFDDCGELAESPEKWECERDAGRAWRGYEEMILDDLREAYEATRHAQGPYDPGSDEDDAPGDDGATAHLVQRLGRSGD